MLDTGVQLLVYTWSYTEWGILQFQNSRVPKHVMFVTKVHLPASRASRVGMRGWSKKQLFAHLGAMPDLTLTSWWNSAFREAGWIWLEGGIFFCADCLILVLMYWTIRFFFLVASTPTQLAQLSNHVILFGYTNHTYRERRMCLSNSQLGGEKNYYPRMKQKFCFDWFPWCYNFPAHHACKVMQMVFGHFLVMQLLISPVAPLLQFVECEKLCLMWWNHAKTMKQPDSLG